MDDISRHCLFFLFFPNPDMGPLLPLLDNWEHNIPACLADGLTWLHLYWWQNNTQSRCCEAFATCWHLALIGQLLQHHTDYWRTRGWRCRSFQSVFLFNFPGMNRIGQFWVRLRTLFRTIFAVVLQINAGVIVGWSLNADKMWININLIFVINPLEMYIFNLGKEMSFLCTTVYFLHLTPSLL